MAAASRQRRFVRWEGALAPGECIVALLVDHEWARALDEAVSRTGGTALGAGFVEATGLSELAPDLLAAAKRSGTSGRP